MKLRANSFFAFILVQCFCTITFANDFFNCHEASANPNIEECYSYINQKDRLPPQIKPSKYKLTIQPYIHLSNETEFFFRGSVSIEVKPEIPHRNILLHVGKNIYLRDSIIQVVNDNRLTIRIKSLFRIKYRKWLLIKLYETLPAGKKFYVHIKRFSSKLTKKTNGFYYFSYKIQKEKRYGANVLLSPFYARNAFPCFDDPIFETPIQFNIIRQDNFVSQSVMNIKRTKLLENGWSTDIYEWTPPMQVYQFTFSVNTFSYISTTTSTGHLIRLWAPREKLHLCEFSLGKIKKSLEFYEKYFNSPYVFDKLDVAITTEMQPYETGSSTYGLLILLDSVTFIDEEKTLPRWKQIYINTIHHEVAHQWIGNVLRIEWFDTLWIIEGLVGYMEQKMRTHQTQYNHRLATSLTQTLTGLYADDSELNHKLSVYPYTAKDVEYYFDDLSFTKGFSMFKMIDRVVGQKNFQYALQRILNDKNLKPIANNDLWIHIDKALKERNIEVPVTEIMSHWQSKRGFPIVDAKLKDGKFIEVSQKGNLFTNKKVLWPIPITYLIKNGEEKSNHYSVIWMTEKKKLIPLDNKVAEDEWFILNPDQLGFFRVNYDLSNWVLLIHQLRNNYAVIPPIARLQILDDVFQFYCNGDIPGGQNIFDIFAYLENETEYSIWKYSKTVIDLLTSIFETKSSYKYFQAFMNKLTNNLVNKIEWHKSDTRTLTIQMRDKLMMTYACRFGNSYCLDRTNEYFNYWLKDFYFSAPLYLYGPILCTGIQQGDRNVWMRVLESLHRPEIQFDQKLLIVQSLSCSRDINIIENYWNMMVSNSTKYKNLYSPLLSTLAKNLDARPVFESRICLSPVNITKNPFEFAATLAALNNFILPKPCLGYQQLRSVRFKRTSGDNFEIESSLSMEDTRSFLLNNHFTAMEKWLKDNMKTSSITLT